MNRKTRCPWLGPRSDRCLQSILEGIFRCRWSLIAKKRNGLWKLPLMWKSFDSHISLEKPSAFPQLPQALVVVHFFNFRGTAIHLKEADFLS